MLSAAAWARLGDTARAMSQENVEIVKEVMRLFRLAAQGQQTESC